MTAPVIWYVNGLKAALDAVLDLGTPKLMLLSDTYTPDQDTHAFIDDVSADEAAGTGYIAGGIALDTPTTTADGASNTASYDCTDIDSISVSCCYGVFYVDTGTPSTSPILNLVDFSNGAAADLTVTGAVINASGIAGITAA